MNRQKSISLFVVFSCAALLGNYLSVTLFFGVDFIFGSIAALVAIRLLGFPQATIIAVIGSAYSFFLWGHPYAMIIFTLEILVVGMIAKRWSVCLTIADAIYWLCLGMPLVWILYSGVMGLNESQALLIMFKQPANGIANAIVATYIIMILPNSLLCSEKSDHGRISLKDLLFTTLLAATFISALALIIYQNRALLENQLKQTEYKLIEQGNIVQRYQQNTPGTLDIANLSMISSPDNQANTIIILNERRHPISSTLPKAQLEQFLSTGEHRMITDKIQLWLPERNNEPLMAWWKRSQYYIEHRLTDDIPYTIILLQAGRSIIDALHEQHTASFVLLFIVIIIGGCVAFFTSHILSNNIHHLALATKDVHQKLEQGIKIDWPSSQITELEQLSQQARDMSDKIHASFDNVNIQAKAIIDSSIEGIVTINEDGVIEGFNSAAENLFGYHGDEILGEKIALLFDMEDGNSTENIIQSLSPATPDAIAGKRQEAQGIRKDDSRLPVELSMSRLQLQDKQIITAFISDISDRKANEKMKQEFISVVSHELRTPLTSIKGSTDIIRSGILDDNPEKVQELMKVTSRNIDRLAELINELLDIEKLESSGMRYQLSLTGINTLLQQVISENEPMAQNAGVTLMEKFDSDGNIRVDPARLRQVLTNFISNAIKFSPTDEHIEVGSQLQGEMVTLYVEDNGQGIPEEFRDYVFEKFSQADNADNRKIQKGTGLGLAIAKRMTEDMGGQIGYKCKPEQGARFYVRFPLVLNDVDEIQSDRQA